MSGSTIALVYGHLLAWELIFCGVWVLAGVALTRANYEPVPRAIARYR